MSCKFNYGDKVWAGNHAAKIISIRKDGTEYFCKVKFENRFLIPKEMEYKESELELLEANKEINNKNKCTCGIEKTYGKIPKENHKDYCDLLNPKKIEAKKEEKERKEEDDLLEQFQLMLGGWDDDDDDDFGFFD